jgi:cyclic pyranopterin monophosphate synthase
VRGWLSASTVAARPGDVSCLHQLDVPATSVACQTASLPRLRDVPSGFAHLDGDGNARMVDVTAKQETRRRAVAWCRVARGPGPVARSVLAEAEVAGRQAAKRVGTLVPLCHPLPLDGVWLQLVADDDAVEVAAVVTTTARTGVEMEALTACAVAALSVIGACGPSDAVIEVLTLLEKTGGRSGAWRRPLADPTDLQRSALGVGDRAREAGGTPEPGGSGS